MAADRCGTRQSTVSASLGQWEGCAEWVRISLRACFAEDSDKGLAFVESRRKSRHRSIWAFSPADMKPHVLQTRSEKGKGRKHPHSHFKLKEMSVIGYKERYESLYV